MIPFSTVHQNIAAITGIAKGLLDAHVQVKINEVAIALQSAIIDLQSTVATVHSEYQEALRAKEVAEQKLVAYEQWEQYRSRYALEEVSSGVFVYALKPEHHAVEPIHWLCATCYSDRKKSILSGHPDRTNVLTCPREPSHMLDIYER